MPRTRIRAKSNSLEVSRSPEYRDPDRREKLATAFPVVCSTFREYAVEHRIPGIAIGIVIDGELACLDTFGVREVGRGAPVTGKSVFRIASMTKSLIAMSILRLRDELKLRLDDPVSKYVPELKRLKYPTTDSPTLTIRHLMTMSPGFPEDNPWGDRQMDIRAGKFTSWLEAGIPFSSAPGITHEYSNYGYAILGRIVTQVAGTPFQTYVRRHILTPLKMHATEWDVRRVPREQMLHGYRWEDGVHKAEPIMRDGSFAGMAGLWTTVPDFARYMSFLLDAFPPRDDPESGPVSRATSREMQQLARFEALAEWNVDPNTPWRAVSGYGFGLAVWHDDRLGHGVSHGGGLPGYGSYFFLLPSFGVGIVALTNKTYGRIGTLFPRVLDLLWQSGGLIPRLVRPSPVLLDMQAVVQRWLEGADDSEMMACAANNFYLDLDAAHRRAVLAAARAEIGPVHGVGELSALNALRGRWRVHGERGDLDILLTLAPTMPPRIQQLSLTVQLNA